jgi:hypothetical protein
LKVNNPSSERRTTVNEQQEYNEKNQEPKDDVEGHVLEQLDEADVEAHQFEQIEQIEVVE